MAAARPSSGAVAGAGPGALECVRALPRDVRIGQTMLVTTADLARVEGWLGDGLIAGLLANGRLTAQTARALEAATTGTAYGALLATDDEGGPVQRYQDVVGAMPSAREQALTMTADQVRDMYRRVGDGLGDWGVDMVLAPVVDVGGGPGIGARAYSDDPGTVTELAGAAVDGLVSAGLIPVLKHFPGHGRTSGDSHYARVTGPTLDQLRTTDLEPYRVLLSDARVGVMVGHTTVPGYSEAPSSQSPAVVQQLLRDELGYDGLVVSDALGMAASGSDSQGEALVGFIRAGGDLGIVGPGGSVEGRRAMRAALASGSLDEERLAEAALRVLAAKGVDPCSLSLQAPVVVDDAGVADPPVINPTEEP